MEFTTMSLPDFETDLFYEGEYYGVDANLAYRGAYKVITDGAGREEYEITVEPEFTDVVIYGPDQEEMDNPDDKLCRAAQAVLESVYWDREFGE